MTTGSKVRAVRNNNPGNIRKGDPWQGLMKPEDMTPDQAAETVFCVFKNPMWGFRALIVTLITYQDKRRAKDGSIIDTLTAAIMRWAPPIENDTTAYIHHVAKITGVGPNDHIDFHSYKCAAPIVKAISVHECGGWFFDEEDLNAGLGMAGVPKPDTAVVESRTVKAATVAAAATSISVVAESVNDITPITGLIRELAEYAPIVAGVAVLCLLGAIVYFKLQDIRRAKG